MKYAGCLIVVDNIDRSKAFYQDVMNQKISNDFGENVSFEGGFSIHLKSHFSSLIQTDRKDMLSKTQNFELYFEEEDLDEFFKKLESVPNLNYVHPLAEQPWGQRSIRFFDPDMHIIEVGEPMESVAKRFIKNGLSIAETAKRISLPEEFVKQAILN